MITGSSTSISSIYILLLTKLQKSKSTRKFYPCIRIHNVLKIISCFDR